jgi:hypothetical protein
MKTMMAMTNSHTATGVEAANVGGAVAGGAGLGFVLVFVI